MKNYKKLKKSISDNKQGLPIGTVKRLIEDLEYRNKISVQFENASPNKKRVMIAKDVLQQLKLSMYRPNSGEFGHINHITGGNSHSESSIHELCATGKMSSCHVCEVGGVFMSTVRLNGDSKVGTHLQFDMMLTTLKKYYTLEQIILMELAFEGAKGYFFMADVADEYDELVDQRNQRRSNSKISTSIDFHIKEIKKLDKIVIDNTDYDGSILYTAASKKQKEQVINALKFYKKNSHNDEKNPGDEIDEVAIKKSIEKRFKLIQTNIIKNKGRIVF